MSRKTPLFKLNIDNQDIYGVYDVMTNSWLSMGGGAINALDLGSAQNMYIELLRQSPYFFTDEVFNTPTRSKIFQKRKMVAL